MEIQYAVMIDTRIQALTGPGVAFLSGLSVTTQDVSPVYADIHRESASTFGVGFYETEKDRKNQENAIGAWSGLSYATTYSNKAFSLSDGTAGTVTIAGVTFAAIPLPLHFQIHRTTIPEIGLYQGSFCWITGTPGYSSDGEVPASAPDNPVTSEPQNTWKEGIIAKDTLGQPSMAVDPSLGGSYSTMSGMDAKVVNMIPGVFNPPPPPPALAPDPPIPMPFGEFLRRKEILLHRCKFRFYQVRDGIFHLVNSFLIEDVVEDDQFVSLQCVDEWLQIHQEMPKKKIKDSFPNAPEDSLDRAYPLCIGRVPTAELIPLAGSINLMDLSGGEYRFGFGFFRHRHRNPSYQTTRAIAVRGTSTLVLKTDGQIYDTDALANMIIRVTRMGVASSVDVLPSQILSNKKSYRGSTEITLVDSFRKANDEIVIPNADTKAPEKAWWYQIYDFKDFRAVSESSIKEFYKGGALYGWDGKNFVDVSRKLVRSYPAGDSPYGPLAGMLVMPEGESALKQPESLVSVSVAGALRLTNATKKAESAIKGKTDTFPLTGAHCENLRDKNRDTYYEKVCTHTVLAIKKNYVDDAVPLKMAFPSTFAIDDDEDLFLGVDADFLVGASSHDRQVWAHATFRLMDLFGSPASEEVEVLDFWPTVIVQGGNAGGLAIRQIGDVYYTNTIGATGSYIQVPDAITAAIKNKDYRATLSGLEVRVRMRTHLEAFHVGRGYGIEKFDVTYRLREVALFQKREAYEGQQYVALTGVTFGAGWTGKTATDPVVSIPDAIEYIIRRQDEAPEVIEAESFQFCRDTVFPPAQADIGRQLVESANSVDYIEELCKHGFCCIVPGRDGKRRLFPINGYDIFTEKTAFPLNRIFDETSILVGSFQDSRILGMDRVYTGLTLKYDYNPAKQEYRKVITVRNTNKPFFPAIETLDAETGSPLWTTYVGGVSDYTTARRIWGGENVNEEDGYRKAYLLSQRQNLHELECPWFISNEHFGIVEQDPAIYLATTLSHWFSVPRVDYTFRVPASPANLALYLLQRIAVKDTIRTNDLYYRAIITALELDPVASEIQVTCQRLLTDKPYDIPLITFEGIVGDDVEAEELDNVGDPVLTIADTVTEVLGGNTLTETFYP